MEKTIYNTPAAAAYVDRSEFFVRRTLRLEVPYIQHRPGGPLYFRKSDLDMWIARHTHVPAGR